MGLMFDFHWWLVLPVLFLEMKHDVKEKNKQQFETLQNPTGYSLRHRMFSVASIIIVCHVCIFGQTKFYKFKYSSGLMYAGYVLL